MENSIENDLERLLRLAATEPAFRPEFIQVLLNSIVYVFGELTDGEVRNDVLQTEGKINIQNWDKTDGSKVIPFFSSIDVMNKSIDREQKYLAISAKSLFEITTGSTLLLNPKSDYGKEFIPQEIINLLGQGVSSPVNRRVVEKATPVLLGQPAIYPQTMVDALKTYFSKKLEVERAFVAMMHDPSTSERPNLVIGVDVRENFDTISREMGMIIDGTSEGKPVDVTQVSEKESGLSQYFLKNTTPFYTNKSGAIKKLFGLN